MALLALTACGSNDQPTAAPATPTAPSASGAVPSAEPSAAPSPDPRSPEGLAGLLTFDAPPDPDPAVQEALLAYADTLQQFVVAQGLGDPDYPPLLARIDPNNAELRTSLLAGLVKNAAADEIFLDPLRERVTDSAGSANRVLIDTCTDYSDRVVHSEATGMDLRNFKPAIPVVRARVVMSPSATGWIVSQYSVPTEQNCT